MVSKSTFASTKLSTALVIVSKTLWNCSGSAINDFTIFGKVVGTTSASERKLIVSNNLRPEIEKPASFKILSAFT